MLGHCEHSGSAALGVVAHRDIKLDFGCRAGLVEADIKQQPGAGTGEMGLSWLLV